MIQFNHYRDLQRRIMPVSSRQAENFLAEQVSKHENTVAGEFAGNVDWSIVC